MKGSSPSIYDDFELLIGVDWAYKKHDICEYDAYSQQYKFSVIPHTPDAIQVSDSQLPVSLLKAH